MAADPNPNPATAIRPGREVTLRDRLPGQAVMKELLARHQIDHRRRSWLCRLLGIHPLGEESQAWYSGALGEITVGNQLARLGPDWTVLHSIPVGSGNSDIDHLVIGPAGVFTINTKNHQGKRIWVADRTLMVSGHKQTHIRNALHEAKRAGSLLSQAVGELVPVQGMIVIIKPKQLNIKENPADLVVLTDRQLLRWFKRRPTVLSFEQLALIKEIAELPQTWHTNPANHENPNTISEDFRTLHKWVRRAKRRRIACALCLLTGMIITILAVLEQWHFITLGQTLLHK